MTVKETMKFLQLTRTGKILGSLYILILTFCVIYAQFITDPKGKYIILQIPVVLQHGLLLTVEATSLLKGMSWFSIYLTLATPMIVLLVATGNIIESIVKKVKAEDQ